MKDGYVKPPIGVISRNHYDTVLSDDISNNGGMCLSEIKRIRLYNLKGAIERYASAKRHINIEWIEEYNELLRYFGVDRVTFRL